MRGTGSGIHLESVADLPPGSVSLPNSKQSRFLRSLELCGGVTSRIARVSGLPPSSAPPNWFDPDQMSTQLELEFNKAPESSAPPGFDQRPGYALSRFLPRYTNEDIVLASLRTCPSWVKYHRRSPFLYICCAAKEVHNKSELLW